MSEIRRVLGYLRRALLGPDDPPGPAPRWLRRFWRVVWPISPLVLVGFGWIAYEYVFDTRQLRGPGLVLIAAVSVLPLLFLPRWPMIAWRLAYLGLFLGTLQRSQGETWPWNPVQLIAYLVILFFAALSAAPGVTAWVGGLTLIPIWCWMSRGDHWGASLLFLVPLVLGEEIGRRRRAQRALEEQAELSELEQARRAVLEERTRIARELHDVVAHHMSLIAVRAETAPYRLAELPDPAREEFTAIAAASREALVDMRRLLGVLRSDGSAPELAPQPGFSDIPALVEAARRAGVDVRFSTVDASTVDGSAADASTVDAGLPAAVGQAAYRIVQEALANAARHARGAPVAVSLSTPDDFLSITVHNGPGADGGTGPNPGGQGLIGMRERAAGLGGTCVAGPAPGGGYQVSVTLPYGRSA